MAQAVSRKATFGGVVDAATGLLYVGNGQYYDPETGRFLNRNAKPEQNNPYIPWGGNPSSALIAPLALLVLQKPRVLLTLANGDSINLG